MPREAAFTKDELTDRALNQFWFHGFNGTSMDALVKSTRASRHGIYNAFGGKKQLFEACFARYQATVVTPAFGPVEEPGADLATMAGYYEAQIALAESRGLPGPGCFVANASTETAPHDARTRTKVDAHNARLRKGFANALENELDRRSLPCGQVDVDALTQVCVIFTNGLWSLSRTVLDARLLRSAVKTFLNMLEGALS